MLGHVEEENTEAAESVGDEGGGLGLSWAGDAAGCCQLVAVRVAELARVKARLGPRGV